MASPTESPFGTYADVTGVVNTTAAAEVAALGVILLALIPDNAVPAAAVGGTPETSPEFDAIRPEYAEKLRLEIAALLAAIAAAPTA